MFCPAIPPSSKTLRNSKVCTCYFSEKNASSELIILSATGVSFWGQHRLIFYNKNEKFQVSPEIEQQQQDPALTQLIQDSSSVIGRVLGRMSTIAPENKKYWKDQIDEVNLGIQELVSAPSTSPKKIHEVQEKIRKMKDREQFYFEKMESAEQRFIGKTEAAVRDGYITPEMADDLKSGLQYIINADTGGNRDQKLEWMKWEEHGLKELIQQNKIIMKEQEKIESIHSKNLPIKGDEIYFFTEAEQKPGLSLIQQIPDITGDKFANRKPLTEKLQKERAHLEKTLKRRQKLFSDGQPQRDEMVHAYKNMGWIDSLPIFAKSSQKFSKLASRCSNEGGLSTYYQRLHTRANTNLQIAQEQSYHQIRQKREDLEQNAGWAESHTEHLSTIQQFTALPPQCLTPQIRSEIREYKKNLTLCAIGQKAEKFGQDLQSGLKLTRILSPQDPQKALEAYHHLEDLAFQYDQKHRTSGDDIRNEYIHTYHHIISERQQLELQVDQDQEEQTLSSDQQQQLIEDLIFQNAGEYIIPLILLSLSWQQEFKQGTEQQRTMTVDELQEDIADQHEHPHSVLPSQESFTKEYETNISPSSSDNNAQYSIPDQDQYSTQTDHHSQIPPQSTQSTYEYQALQGQVPPESSNAQSFIASINEHQGQLQDTPSTIDKHQESSQDQIARIVPFPQQTSENSAAETPIQNNTSFSPNQNITTQPRPGTLHTSPRFQTPSPANQSPEPSNVVPFKSPIQQTQQKENRESPPVINTIELNTSAAEDRSRNLKETARMARASITNDTTTKATLGGKVVRFQEAQRRMQQDMAAKISPLAAQQGIQASAVDKATVQIGNRFQDITKPTAQRVMEEIHQAA